VKQALLMPLWGAASPFSFRHKSFLPSSSSSVQQNKNLCSKIFNKGGIGMDTTLWSGLSFTDLPK
jgi:hypothetical protein